MARDRRLDGHRAVGEMPPRERRIHALHAALLDRAGQAPVREVRLRDQE